MDINELKKCEELFELEVSEMGFNLDKVFGTFENPYKEHDSKLAYELFKKGWQAKSQAVPEGFVLVEKERLARAVNDIEVLFEEDCTLALGQLLPIQQDLNAMIEAQEQSNV